MLPISFKATHVKAIKNITAPWKVCKGRRKSFKMSIFADIDISDMKIGILLP